MKFSDTSWLFRDFIKGKLMHWVGWARVVEVLQDLSWPLFGHYSLGPYQIQSSVWGASSISAYLHTRYGYWFWWWGSAESHQLCGNKYGKEQEAQIVTFSTMAAKSSIRDVGRVLDYPLLIQIALPSLVPNRPKVHLEDLLDKPEDVLSKSEYNSDEMVQIQTLRSIPWRERL